MDKNSYNGVVQGQAVNIASHKKCQIKNIAA